MFEILLSEPRPTPLVSNFAGDPVNPKPPVAHVFTESPQLAEAVAQTLTAHLGQPVELVPMLEGQQGGVHFVTLGDIERLYPNVYIEIDAMVQHHAHELGTTVSINKAARVSNKVFATVRCRQVAGLVSQDVLDAVNDALFELIAERWGAFTLTANAQTLEDHYDLGMDRSEAMNAEVDDAEWERQLANMQKQADDYIPHLPEGHEETWAVEPARSRSECQVADCHEPKAEGSPLCAAHTARWDAMVMGDKDTWSAEREAEYEAYMDEQEGAELEQWNAEKADRERRALEREDPDVQLSVKDRARDRQEGREG